MLIEFLSGLETFPTTNDSDHSRTPIEVPYQNSVKQNGRRLATEGKT